MLKNKKILLLVLVIILISGAVILYKLYSSKNTFFSKTFDFAVIDLEQIFRDAPQVKLLKDKMNDQFNPRQENINSLEADIQKEAAKLNRSNQILKLAERKKILSDLFAKQKKMLKMKTELQDDIAFMEKASTETVMKQVQDAATDLAQERKVLAIFNKDVVAYANNHYSDLSIEIINRLQKE